ASMVQIFGSQPQQKQQLATITNHKMQGTAHIVNLSSSADPGRPELRITMDRERMSRIGMSSSEVATALSNAIKGNLATTYVDKGIEFEVLVQLQQNDKASVSDLRNLQIETPEGSWVPLSGLARIERYRGPTNILRINQERVTEVSADLAGIDLKDAAAQTRRQLDEINWPEG